MACHVQQWDRDQRTGRHRQTGRVDWHLGTELCPFYISPKVRVWEDLKQGLLVAYESDNLEALAGGVADVQVAIAVQGRLVVGLKQADCAATKEPPA